MGDGERIDGYRCFGRFFSNFVLIDESSGLDGEAAVPAGPRRPT
jgi:hypothetical protein